MTIFKGNLVTHEVDIESFNLNWVKLSINPENLKIAYNVIMIMEVLFAQLSGHWDLSAQGAMQSSLHRTGMVVLNSPLIQQFITIIVIDETSEFSTEVKDLQLKEQYTVLLNRKGARESKYKKVKPDIDMDPNSLMKYRIGKKFSIGGKFQTIPVYSPILVSDQYKLSLGEIDFKLLRPLSPFPEQFQKAIDFIKGIFESKNPHYFDDLYEQTDIMRNLGIEIRSSRIEIEEINIEDSLSEEEKKRAQKVNDRVKKAKIKVKKNKY